MKGAPEELRAIELIRSTSFPYPSDGLYFCGIPEAANTVTVYIYVAQTAGTIQPSTVINQRLRIYKEDGVTPADRGIYGYIANNEYMQGRRWYGAVDGYFYGHWDTISNYADQNQGYLVQNGLYICVPTTGGGGNETGGGDDNNNIGLQ